ncbi:Mitochondrial inner membrane protease subunit 1 [Smittium culicis]|uniref:Mitochondrial inner membrane protease subunit n=1 Tax=Smittium culicis TaxID=133412 RepID=A0A1R1X8B7_9FUNG|nr:Mitochondrial inner membrane protease subunit 1 [Smittium culicis]
MMPTISSDNDLLVIKKLSDSQKQHLDIGDLVVSYSPNDPSKLIVKRLLGTVIPTETFSHLSLYFSSDTVILDPLNSPLSERKITVPAGHCWLQGDNYHASLDSRSYGPVPCTLLIGKVVFKT